MVAPAFEYVAAGSYDEAVRLLAGATQEARILACLLYTSDAADE